MRFRTANIQAPPIVKLSEMARKYVGSANFIDMGQGLPGHIPSQKILSSLSERISHPITHRYTSDQGHLELREELALYLRKYSRIDADPEKEIAITAGGNQAFTNTVFTLLEPGDNVIIPSPYYFNSVMAIELAGGSVTEVPVGNEFIPNPDHIRSAITERTKAILLVSPNNPTGAVYDRKTVDQIVSLCLEHDIILISDEAYSRLVFDDAEHYSPLRRRDAHDNVIVLGSFSKDFGISGWRIGYVVGPDVFMDEFMKVQDTVSICAPTASQMLVLDALKSDMIWVEEELARLEMLRDFAYLRAKEIESFEMHRTKGTFYLFPRIRGCTNSRKLVLDMLQNTKVLVLPGSIFGTAGEGHIRISIGPLTADAVDEAFARMESFFSNYRME